MATIQCKNRRLYGIWSGMRTRCHNKNYHDYQWYGGLGISVCAEWDNFYEFQDWALKNGYQDNLTLDRKDGDSNYCPENCRWVTRTEQSRNRKSTRWLTYNGETKTLSEWAKIVGLRQQTLNHRINSGHFTVQEALFLPSKLGNNWTMTSKK